MDRFLVPRAVIARLVRSRRTGRAFRFDAADVAVRGDAGTGETVVVLLRPIRAR
jgi:hypothetical protein